MLQPCREQNSSEHILQIPVCDRWRIYHRLQELMIPCWCLPDGSLRVQIEGCLAAFLVRSTVLQLKATRQELIDWLEQCWQA
ncbi:Asr1405/Asl0597 family protein [Scytonema sp. NUACC26]|jgi:hypothetical protein|uniref:Asr1405/Asl0597 family protein n=1 Tax=Scytonema sp. NUACC26 TaxID=3140176 RepID=UPI0034DC9918